MSLKELKTMQQAEIKKWKEGYVSGAVYHGDNSHIEYLDESLCNPLAVEPAAHRPVAEREQVRGRSHFDGRAHAFEGAGESVQSELCGSVTSGGSESILLAMKTYRDMAEAERGVKNPEMVASVTAHAAFDKAAQYFKIKLRVKYGCDSSFRADLNAVKKAINSNTVVVIGSAPAFPHGVVDPIEEMSELARAEKNSVSYRCMSRRFYFAVRAQTRVQGAEV